ncbi:MAG TPA: GntG family PLP-dependent aldolase [Vicinamibacterales bacterium]|nr:GntG family PLP-dependent aldolase [Vicinamibacterales bacterium]
MKIDLRSDTVTLPSPEMRQAMAEAELGDDVYGEDPTVARLERLAAGMTGMEASLFVSSGTMGNLASLLAHCERGREVIVGDEAHIFHYENGSASALGGLVLHTVPTRADGTLPLGAIEAAIRQPAHHYHYYHYAPTGVICLENTHNRCGGTVISPEYFAEVAAIARRHDVRVHLDGARLFNAALAAGRPVTEWTRHVDSVQLCLSKGLAAPVGSMICGSGAFVDKARRMRKVLGGGMRQAGVIAAPGIVALTAMVDRLTEDHANARVLAGGLSRIPGIVLDPPRVDTNIVVFRLPGVAAAEAYAEALALEGLLVSDFGGGRLRVVTHYGITEDDCRRAVDTFARVAQAIGLRAAGS